MIYHFMVLGSEARQIYLAEFLQEAGHEVMLSEEYLPGYHDAVLLPVPQTAKYLQENLSRLQKGQLVYGCNFPQPLITQCTEKGIRCIDYMEQDGVASLNAIATAEGAVAEALKAACVSIHGSQSLVAGYGHCGEVLAEKLMALKANVTVLDRKEEKRARARTYGCHALDFTEIKDQLYKYDFIFNTIPAHVLDEDLLSHVKRDVTIIDLASKPGGVNFEYCRNHSIDANLCLGLPGKYAPKSSAKILMEVIFHSQKATYFRYF